MPMSASSGLASYGLFDGRQPLAQLQQAGVATHHEVGGRFFGFGHVLRDLGHAPLFGHVKVAAVFVQRAVEHGKQGGLARAVAPHQADFFAGVDGDVGAVKQHFGAAAQDDDSLLEGDHCRG
jgi:hypothetical protein